MRKFLPIGIIVILVAGTALYLGLVRRGQAAAAGTQQAGERGQAGGGGRGDGGPMGRGFGGPGGGFRPPMTVEVTRVARGRVSQTLTVVGNLIGEQTVDVVPRTGGRITAINVKLGDRVRRGQVLAKIEDRELVEQVRQAEASHEVAQATIRQREADLNLAQTNVERSRNLYGRQLLPKQTLDDAEARYTSAMAALDLARAQLAQSQARLQELRINLGHTNVVSPVDGFVARRDLDIGAFASNNAPVASVVDISSLRLVANVVEKDLRAVTVGDRASVNVDAFPGEKFSGRIARLSPVLDPTTRTAQMEVEIANPSFRLKPGMYARIDLTVEDKEGVLVIPKIALVDSQGERGVYQASAENKATFKPVKVGIENNETAEILEGLSEGEQIVSTGAGALRRDDQLVIAGMPGQDGQSGPAARGRGRGNRGGRSGSGVPDGMGAPGAPGTPRGGPRAPGDARSFGAREPGGGAARPEGDRAQRGGDENWAGRQPAKTNVRQQRPTA
jgi:RND family efflux transporter MFP subunit